MTFQPERLTFARKRRQLSQTDLARLTGLVPKTLRRYEYAEEQPREENLVRLSTALGFPVEFFLDARPLPEIAPRSLSFRAYSKLRARERESAVAIAQLAVDIEATLVEQFELPEMDVPDLRESASDPMEAARLLRLDWQLGTGPIANMVHLLEARGVRVFSLALDSARVDAFCFWHDNHSFVVLNRTKTAERGRFDCAHELAHLVLHRQVDFRSKDVEREADAFAGEFLVPRSTLERQVPSFITIETVLKLKQHWGVSAMAMVRRLRDVGRLTEWAYRSLIIELTSRGYRTGEPGGMEQETSGLLAEMFSTEDGISVGALARALHVSVGDVTPLLFKGRLRLVHSEP